MPERDEKAREYADQTIRRRTPPFGENAHKDIMEDFAAGHRSRDAEVRELVEALRELARANYGPEDPLSATVGRAAHQKARALLDRHKGEADAP